MSDIIINTMNEIDTKRTEVLEGKIIVLEKIQFDTPEGMKFYH